MQNFIQRGDTLTLIAPEDVASGGVVIVGGFVGIAACAAEAGEEIETNLTGVYELPKAAEAVSQGDKLYWDSGNGELTGTAAGNTSIGLATAAFGSAASTATVRLTG